MSTDRELIAEHIGDEYERFQLEEGARQRSMDFADGLVTALREVGYEIVPAVQSSRPDTGQVQPARTRSARMTQGGIITSGSIYLTGAADPEACHCCPTPIACELGETWTCPQCGRIWTAEFAETGGILWTADATF